MTFYKFMVGVVLALAMVLVLTLGALVFSARDFQWGVRQIAEDSSGVISFADLDRASAEIDAIEAEVAQPRGQLLEIEQQLAGLDAQIQNAQAELGQSAATIVRGIAQIEAHAGVEAAQSAAADMTAQGLSQRVSALAQRSGLSPEDQEGVAQLHTQVQALANQEGALDDHADERATLLEQQRLAGLLVADANQRVLALQASVVPQGAQFERIRNEANALRTLSPLGVSAYFAQGHPALLSTLLVLLMGSLGSLLYLFPAYLNRPAPVTIAEIIVRLIFGMCAALAFYVLANAAVGAFSISSAPTATQPGASSALNPFTVSLIGIVAGVLSEDIASWIQERGRGIFTQGGGRPPAPPAADNDGPPGGGLVNNQAIS